MQHASDELRLLHALGLAVLSTDESGTVVLANEAATALFARTSEELTGQRLADVLGVEDPDVDEPLALDRVLTGRTWRGDLVVRRPDEARPVVSVTATPVRAADGSVLGAIVALEDITELRRAEAEAGESEQRLRLAHAAAELGTWHWNAVDGSNVWDDQMHHIYGLPPGGFDGTWDAWVASIHPDDREEAIAVVQRALEERSTYVLRNRIVRPDGRPTWIEAHGKVLVTADGAPAGTIGCVRDVTQRILLEQRKADDAARAVLLQQVTADFSRATTAAEVAKVLTASLDRVQTLVGDDVVLTVPSDLTAVTGSRALVATGQTGLSAEDARLLDTLATQCAIAAERAALLQHTVAISAELQSSLAASPLPASERVELAASYAPGGDDLEQVGGDWYDAVVTPEGRLALVIGDVMGRGVRAATTMIHVRAGLRGLLTVQPSPAALLETADRLTARDAPEQFVTAAAVLVDAEAGTVEISNAGHVPLVVVRADGTTVVSGLGSGLPLGVQPGTPRSAETLEVGTGALLVLVTDGVVESRDDDLEAGIERLRRRATELRDRPLAEVVAGLASLADDRMHDDVTVVVARLR